MRNDLTRDEIVSYSEAKIRDEIATRQVDSINAIGDVRGMSSDQYEAAKAKLRIRRYTPMKLG